MATAIVSVDLNDRELRKLLEKIRRQVKPKRFTTLLRSVINGGTAPIRRDIRRLIRNEDAIRFGHMYRAVASKVKVYASGVVFAIVGVKHKRLPDGENPANYWHLVSEGTKPHQQQARVQINGRWILLPGTQHHPGAHPRNIRSRAAQSAASDVMPRMLKRAQTIFEREVAG
jgi:hypothetical protein